MHNTRVLLDTRGLSLETALHSLSQHRRTISYSAIEHHFHISRTPDVDFHRLRSVPEAFLFLDTGLGQGRRHKIVSAQSNGLARENAPLNTTIFYRDFKPHTILTAVPRLMADSAIQTSV